MSSRHGFSLIELVVVTGIIAVLASLLLPAVAKVREVAKCIQCLSSLRQVGIAMQAYLDDGGGWYPTSRQDNIDGTSSNRYWFEHLQEALDSGDTNQNGTLNSRDLEGTVRNVLTGCPNRPITYSIYPFGYGLNGCLKTPNDPRRSYWDESSGTYIDYNVSQVTKRPLRILAGDGNAYHITAGSTKYAENWAPNRHGRVANYLFCDMRVQSVEPIAAKAAIANPGSVPLP
jgi:prepilin-type N-terminal cleavage/methylation domain-containing protein/prepilin-type processing-associated H-X9-DG protein